MSCEGSHRKLLPCWILAHGMPFSLSHHGTNIRQFGWIDFIRNRAVKYFSILSAAPHREWRVGRGPNSLMVITYVCNSLFFHFLLWEMSLSGCLEVTDRQVYTTTFLIVHLSTWFLETIKLMMTDSR